MRNFISCSLLISSLIFISLQLGDINRQSTYTTCNHTSSHYHSDYCKVSPSPYPTNLMQADGSSITALIKGNHIVYHLETLDGYTIQKDKDGFYKYAIQDKKNGLIVTEQVAHNISSRTNEELAFLSTLDKHIAHSAKFTENKIASHKSSVETHRSSHAPTGGGFPTTGNQKALLLLIDYPDQPFTYDSQSFEDLMNDANYTVNGASGSFKQYYLDASLNQLEIDTDVVGWYTAQYNRSYYAGSYKATDLVKEAVDAAEAQGLDFSQYDGDGDGAVDVVMVIHAGRGQEASGNSDDIWSHRWRLSAGGNQVNYDGKAINDYIIQPELLGTDIASIGVLVHEFGHALNLPDLYDTDNGVNGQGQGSGNWCLMAGGTWNNYGRTPAQPSAWCKSFLGWGTPTVLEEATTITDLGAWDETGNYYKVPTSNVNEYYLISNRQKIGWDSYLPGEGLNIWYINETVLTVNPIWHNRVNSNSSNYGVQLIQADNNNDLNNGINRGDAGDAYPGTSNNTSLDCGSMPSASFADGSTNNIKITDISITNGLANFRFGECVSNTMVCSDVIEISCGDIVNGTTVGKTNLTDHYSCSEDLFSGNEVVYKINIIADNTPLSANLLTSDNENLSLFLLNDCNNGACQSADETAINTTLNIGTYYLIVDGKNGANADFQLSLDYCYCPSMGQSINDEWIQKLTIGEWSHESGSNAGYGGFTENIVSLKRSRTYNLNLIPGFRLNSYREYWRVWIDLNQDGDFLDSGELVFDPGRKSSNNVTGSLRLPCDALLGKTKMRVSMKYNAPAGPCETFQYGEVEDYTVEIEAFEVPNSIPDISSNEVYAASFSCTDESGWTHYMYNDGVEDYLLLSILPNENETSLEVEPSDVTVKTMDTYMESPNADASIFDYVENEEQWHTLGRYWNITLEENEQPDYEVLVRSYLTMDDFQYLQEHAEVYNIDINSTADLVPFKVFNSNTPWDYTAIANDDIVLYDNNMWEPGTTTGNMYCEFSVSSFSGGGIGIGSPFLSALPIDLDAFSGRQEEEQLALFWHTVTESEASHFELERLNNNQFEKIGVVDARNENDQYYDFSDTKPMVGVNYYRLKMVNLDGSFDYSKVIALEYVQTTGFSVYPNPISANKDVNVEIVSAISQSVSIELYTVQGQLLVQETLNITRGQTMFKLPVGEISAGIYMVQMRYENNQTEMIKLIKR